MISEDEKIQGFLVMNANNYLQFVNHWGVSVPTTCCYQFITPKKFKEEKLETIKFFVLTGLGICYPIKYYRLHCFTAATFGHCTSTVLYWLVGKVYVRRTNGVNFFSWEKSGPSTGVTQQNSCRRRGARIDGTGNRIFQQSENVRYQIWERDPENWEVGGGRSRKRKGVIVDDVCPQQPWEKEKNQLQ